MGTVSAAIGGGLGFERVAACGHALVAVAEPRLAAIPAEGAGELPPVANAGLVVAGYDTTHSTLLSLYSPTGELYGPASFLPELAEPLKIHISAALPAARAL